MTKDSAIGKRITRIDAVDKVTGKALYAADIVLPDMLHGKILRSPYAHANIRRIDISKAQALEGVMAVITVADVPDKKMMSDSPYAMQPLLAFQRVMYEGQPVAAVAARTPYIAEEALKLIEVDYEVLPCVIDMMEAIKPDAIELHADDQTDSMPEKNSKFKNVFCYYENNVGDIDAGFKEADFILENTYRTQVVHHGQLEPRAALANVDPQGKITVWSDNQSIFLVRDLVSEFMDVPLTNVNAVNVAVGGAFGAKAPQMVAPISALLSSKAGRPVRIVTTREETFKDTRPTPASVTTVKMGATKEGKITAISLTMFYDYGCLHGVAGLIDYPLAVFTGTGPYRIPNLHIESYSVFTNKSPSGPYRAPTVTQGAFPIESQIDLLARELNMDPLDLRLKNVAEQGDFMLMTAIGFGPIGFRETMEKMKQYLAGRPKLTGENRGRGIACGYYSPVLGSASASVILNLDGSVQVFVGSTDISGSHTSLAQIAACELGIPLESVSVAIGDTNTSPYGCESVGSGTVLNTARAISRACQDVKEQLCQRGADYLQLESSELEYVDGVVRAKNDPDSSVTMISLAEETWGVLTAVGPIIGHGSEGGLLSAPQSPVLAIEAADVEVDKETGKVKLLSLAIAQDTGVAVNPLSIEGQMQGAATQGMGWALYEGSIFQGGVMQNGNFSDYRMPTALDMPFIDTLIVEVKSEMEPIGQRGVGEPPIVPGPAALANAIHSATGVRFTELPMSPEVILNGIKKKGRTQKK